METTEIIKANFEKFKTKKNLTIQKIALKKGVTRQTIYSYFREGITLRTIEKMAQLVGVEPWQLLQPPQAQTLPAQDDNGTTEQTTTAVIICPHCQKPVELTIKPNLE